MHRTSNRYRKQQGATAVFVAITLVPLLIATMFAIEVGRVYYAHRGLQKLANLAALDAARVVSGCDSQSLPTQADLNAAAQTSIANNGATGIVQTVTVEPGVITTDKLAGSGSGVIRYLTPVSATNTTAMQDAHGVRVTLTRKFPTSLTPFLSKNGSTMIASATAEQPALASFRLGTTLLTLDQGGLNQLLTALLGTNVNLSLVGYQGIAQARVNIANLMVAANVTNVNDLLALKTNLPGALKILGNALSLASDATSGTAGGLISGLATQSFTGSSPVTNYFGQALNGLGSALNPTVSTTLSAIPFVDGLGLLTALGTTASKGNTIQVPVTTTVPGVASLGVFLKVLQPEQPSNLPGRAGYSSSGTPFTTASSSQIVTQIRILLNGIDLGIISLANVRLAIDVQAANGNSILTRVSCPYAGNPASATIQTTASLLTATVGTFSGSATAQPVNGPSSGAVITAVNIPLVLSLSITTTVGTRTFGTTVTQTGSGPTFPVALPTISSAQNLTTVVSSLLSSNLSITLNVLGLPISLSVGNILSAILTPVVSLLDGVLDPLLNALGVKTGVAGVTLDSITTAQPQIVTTALPAGQ
ncbi:pilus assembly protein TadG-related protein [Solimonas terrae]|uniref:Putative Flp pilus-assembly TadG-like N-terminal domain-containing protein n=1 Tax=Solimonas terrae TaxID=1396819 RepID=A0A6M2BU34_9GAMM|nr:pilus assembly protein TadG-related protein [Solimonas terrae]NGY05499.1 hypothetical protein [Solimonas terrae]